MSWLRWPAGPRTAGWSRVLLLVDRETIGPCDPAVRLATGITAPGGVLDVLAPVLVPLSTPLGAPPGEETDRAAQLLEHVERLAGRYGVRVHGHLLRGRSVRAMLREVVEQMHPEVAVLRCVPRRCAELLAEVGSAMPVIVPEMEGEGTVEDRDHRLRPHGRARGPESGLGRT